MHRLLALSYYWSRHVRLAGLNQLEQAWVDLNKALLLILVSQRLKSITSARASLKNLLSIVLTIENRKSRSMY
jgi:hypothetical protein